MYDERFCGDDNEEIRRLFCFLKPFHQELVTALPNKSGLIA